MLSQEEAVKATWVHVHLLDGLTLQDVLIYLLGLGAAATAIL